MRGKLPLKFTCAASTSTCPTTLLNKVELHCKDSAQNITCGAGQVQVLFRLPDCHFLPNSLATFDGASVYVARCITKVVMMFSGVASMNGLSRYYQTTHALWTGDVREIFPNGKLFSLCFEHLASPISLHNKHSGTYFRCGHNCVHR